MPPIISVQSLRKTYGKTVAVDDISFDVAEGEIFGLLGPNGVGKTTTVECLQALRYVILILQNPWLGLAWDTNASLITVGITVVSAGLAARFFRWE
jgi:ABC-type branched-subunit amino acid transport system ATPase component